MLNTYVVIPMYNEAENVARVVAGAKKYAKVIVVDDGSTDGSAETLTKTKGITLLSHLINLGKGAALRTGYEYAVKQGAGSIIMMDSDGQHDYADLPKFKAALRKYDVVFSYRYSKNKMPFILRIGNWGLSKITSIMFNVKVKDSQCGFRGFTAEAYRKVRWRSPDFEADNEMIANVGAKRLNYTEIPINTVYLDKYKGTTVVSGMKIGFRIILMKLRWY